MESAKSELRSVVDETIKDGVVIENPITHARGEIDFQEHATPAMKILSDQIDVLMRKVNKLENERGDTFYSALDRHSNIGQNRSAIVRDVQIVFDPSDVAEIQKYIFRLIPGAMVRKLHPDTAVIRFEASDNDIELITRDLKRHPGILEVDRL